MKTFAIRWMQPRSNVICLFEMQPCWLADLQLKFVCHEGRTFLAKKQHSGPLVIQKTLYPEGGGICHGIIIHPPGGVAGGDQLSLTAELGWQAHVLLTTPGAGKWYKANGQSACQKLSFNLEKAAILEWLPQETIIFDAAQAGFVTQVELASGACYAGWEILCLGRQASGEKFTDGRLRQRMRIMREGRQIWGEFADLYGGDALLDSPVGLNGCTVTATFVIAAGATPPEVLEACRHVVPTDSGHWGVTALPEVFSARYVGNSAQVAREYFEALWAILRPWYAAREARRPRIWNT